MEITPSQIAAAAIALAATGWHWWIQGKVKAIGTLFDKHDVLSKELGTYKLHVAETYVNQSVLEKALAPINEALKEIRQDLHNERRERP